MIVYPPIDENVVPAIQDIERWLPSGYRGVRIVERPISGIAEGQADRWATWPAALAAGMSWFGYSEDEEKRYLKHCSAPMRYWMKVAYLWCRANPGKFLLVDGDNGRRGGNRGYIWHIGLRGEYVEFSLPHQEHGGERAWICRTGKSMVLVNKD